MNKIINAQDALDAIDANVGILYDSPTLVTSLKKMVNALPTVDAVPVVTGTWKAVTDDGENYKRICTCCGKEAPFDELEGVYLIYPHCPWCGADMRGEE